MAETQRAKLIRRRITAVAGLDVLVDDSDGVIRLDGLVDSAEDRQAAEDIATGLAGDARIENDLEIEVLLAEDDRAVAAGGSGDLTDAGAAAGPTGSRGDVVSTGDVVYAPAIDPVVEADRTGDLRVLGGFEETRPDPAVVARSTDGPHGDDALGEAVRSALRLDAATTALVVEVAVRSAVVRLRGRVSDLDDAENAVAVASSVPGVTEVVDELEVRPA
jgi:osmotically-inducible protein OsmY